MMSFDRSLPRVAGRDEAIVTHHDTFSIDRLRARTERKTGLPVTSRHKLVSIGQTDRGGVV